jgi:3-oxoacyl-[acyl-carrier-protein] synthase-3
MSVGLEAITAYLPEKIITRDEFSYLEPMMPNFQDAPLERRRCEREDAVEFMGIEVARKVLEEANLNPGDIDLVIVQTTGGHVVMPGLGAHVHHTLGMKHEAPAWNVQQCCGSWVDSCNMAWNMINANEAFDRVLVMAGPALPRHPAVTARQPLSYRARMCAANSCPMPIAPTANFIRI